VEVVLTDDELSDPSPSDLGTSGQSAQPELLLIVTEILDRDLLGIGLGSYN
jgi:hypothetical protein